jgi:hypothetical protein
MLWLLLGTLTLCAPLHAQDARTCFAQIPDTLLPLLTRDNRADFIDFLDSHMRAEVTNRLEGKSVMTQLTPDYIHIQLTRQSTWQMKLLATSDTTRIVCVVRTACAPACDSQVTFYNTQWQPLAADSLLTLPTRGDFVALPDTVQSYAVRSALGQADFLLIQATLAPAEPTLTASFATMDYLNAEAAEKLAPYVRRDIVYRWNGSRFVR